MCRRKLGPADLTYGLVGMVNAATGVLHELRRFLRERRAPSVPRSMVDQAKAAAEGLQASQEQREQILK